MVKEVFNISLSAGSLFPWDRGNVAFPLQVNMVQLFQCWQAYSQFSSLSIVAFLVQPQKIQFEGSAFVPLYDLLWQQFCIDQLPTVVIKTKSN